MGLDPLDLIFRLEKRFDIDISRAEGTAVLFDTAGTLHRYLVAKLRGECQKVPEIEPLFLEVARAVNRSRGWWRLTLTQDLNRRFPPDARADNWKALEAALGIVLPPLEKDGNEDRPHVPRCCDSVMAIAYWIAERHPERVKWVPVDCARTEEGAVHQWSEDEVWEAMCECICDALGVDPERI